MNRSIPHLSISENILDNSSSLAASIPNLGVFVKLFACVNVDLRTPDICDIVRAGEFFPDNGCMADDDDDGGGDIFIISVLVVVVVVVAAAAALSAGDATAVVLLEDPDEMANDPCLELSSNCNIGKSNSSCLSTRINNTKKKF